MEILQYLLPLGRHFAWQDILANTGGCMIGAYLHLKFFTTRDKTATINYSSTHIKSLTGLFPVIHRLCHINGVETKDDKTSLT
jgi:hypothetical protein